MSSFLNLLVQSTNWSKAFEQILPVENFHCFVYYCFQQSLSKAKLSTVGGEPTRLLCLVFNSKTSLFDLIYQIKDLIKKVVLSTNKFVESKAFDN